MTWSELAWLVIFLGGSAGAIWWLARRPRRPYADIRAGASSGESGSFLVYIYVLGQAAVTVGAAYVIIHFVVKYW